MQSPLGPVRAGSEEHAAAIPIAAMDARNKAERLTVIAQSRGQGDLSIDASGNERMRRVAAAGDSVEGRSGSENRFDVNG
jgi:hypothetical protein